MTEIKKKGGRGKTLGRIAVGFRVKPEAWEAFVTEATRLGKTAGELLEELVKDLVRS